MFLHEGWVEESNPGQNGSVPVPDHQSNTPSSKSPVVTVAPSEGSVPVHPDYHHEATVGS